MCCLGPITKAHGPLGSEGNSSRPDAGTKEVLGRRGRNILPSRVWPVVICLHHAHPALLHTSQVPIAQGPQFQKTGRHYFIFATSHRPGLGWIGPRKGHGTLRIQFGQINFLCPQTNRTSGFPLGTLPPWSSSSEPELQTQIKAKGTNENTCELS